MCESIVYTVPKREAIVQFLLAVERGDRSAAKCNQRRTASREYKIVHCFLVAR